MRKSLKVVGLLLAGLLVVAMLGVAWLLGTQSGGRFAVAQARGYLPEGISIGAVSGRLGGRPLVTDLAVVQDGLTLEIDELWLDWSPLSLFDGHVEVAELGARGVRYEARATDAPAEAPGEPFQFPASVSLPVTIRVDELRVESISAIPAPDGEPLEVALLRAAGVDFADSQLAIEALVVEGTTPQLTLNGAAELRTEDDYPLDVDLDWRLALADLAPLSGRTRLDGSLASLQLEQTLDPPYDLRLAGTISDLTKDPTQPGIAARITTGQVELKAIGPGLPEAIVRLDTEIAGTPQALDVAADIDAADAAGRRARAELRAALEGTSVRVERLVVSQPDHAGELSGSGTVAFGEALAADLDIGWQDLGWPLTGEPTLTSSGALRLSGPPDDYRLQLSTRVDARELPPVTLELDGSGSLEQLTTRLDATVGTATARGQVEAAWAPAVAAQATLEVRDLDPAVFAPDWPGAVNANLTADLSMDDQGLTATLSELTAAGSLRDQPLAVRATGSFRQETTWLATIDTLEASLGGSRLGLSGTAGDTVDLAWELASTDLATLLPDAAGKLSGSGTLRGPVPQVQVQATLDGTDLAYAGERVGRLELDADVDLTGERASTLQFGAQDVTVAGNGVQRLSLQADGTAADHRIELSAEADLGRVNLGMDGSLADPWSRPAWTFTPTSGELAYQALAPWQLRDSEPGQVTADRQHLGRQCWRTGDSSLCLEGGRSPAGLDALLDLQQLPLNYFAALLPPGIQPSGTVSVDVQLSQPADATLGGQVRLSTSAGEVRLAPDPADEAADGPTSIAFEPSEVSVDLDAAGSRAAAAFNLEYGRLLLDLESPVALPGAATGEPAATLADTPLAGRVTVDIPDLAFIARFAPEIERLQGSMGGELTLGGSVGAPTVDGSLELDNGLAAIPLAGLELKDLELSLIGRGRSAELRAAARSGGGNLELAGELGLPGSTPTARLTLRGDAFQVVNNHDAQVFLSPDLTIDAGAERIDVSGELHVPRASITPASAGPSAVTASEDQVLISEDDDAGTEESARPLHAEVRLTLGDAVSFDGFGLTARFEGDVLAKQTPGSPTTASGELRIVDGEYRAYGQGLVIDSGRIFFAGGPVTQPALDVRAVRRPKEGVLVGAHVQGTLRAPTFTLFSEPSMTQQEQLSYLVLGRSMEDTPDGEGSALNRAALAMGIKGGDFLAKNIGQAVGVDQIGIETGSGEAGAPSDPNDASLVVGKYLSPRLYVSYGIGLFDPESVLELQYEISRRWKLITQSSGESTGADLLYTVELGSGSADGQ